jgi:hypothetical protein
MKARQQIEGTCKNLCHSFEVKLSTSFPLQFSLVKPCLHFSSVDRKRELMSVFSVWRDIFANCIFSVR